MPQKAERSHKPDPEQKSKRPAQAPPENEYLNLPEQVQSEIVSQNVSPSTVMYLQRTLGNQQVMRLLNSDASPKTQADGQSINISQHSSQALQRKIGFEFQINASKVKPVNGVKRLKKGAAIGSKLDGLEPTVDVNQSGDYDLEFVSDAFDEDNEAGWKAFIKAVQRTAVTTNAITGLGTKLASDLFVGGLNDHDVTVTNNIGVVHITQGIQLDKLHNYLTGYGFRNLKTRKGGERYDDKPEKLADFTEQVIAEGKELLQSTERRQGFGFTSIAKNEYLSVISLIAGNMSRLQGIGPYLKSYFKSMNRTDVATMMKQVKSRMLEEIKENKPGNINAFTDGDLKALFQVPLWQVLNLSQKLIPRMPFNEDAETWTASGLGEITRIEWLNALWEGNDMLSAKWQSTQASFNKAQAAISDNATAVQGFEGAAAKHGAAADILESVGGYGEKTDADQTGTSLRPIFEIRDVGNVKATDLEKWAQLFGEYIKNLNAGTETRPFYEIWQAIGKK